MLSRPPRDNEPLDGVPIEFVSQDMLRSKSFQDKLAYILDRVQDNMILVLEESLTPEEKKELITQSVEHIDDTFPGIEFSSMENRPRAFEKMMNTFARRVLRKEQRSGGLTIVGNSNVMEKVKENRNSISLLAKTQDSASRGGV